MSGVTYSRKAASYSDDRMHTVWSLLLTSIQYFKRALQISDFAALDATLKADLKEGFDARMRFASEALIDSVKFTICFENYFKAKTLEAGYLIHEINGGPDGRNRLKKRQQKNPILIDEYLQHDRIQLDKTRVHDLPGLSPFTLKFGIFLKDSYKAIIQAPAEIVDLADRLAKYRNTLHFLVDHVHAYSPEKLIEELRLMTNFVNQSMVTPANAMIGNHGFKEVLRQQPVVLENQPSQRSQLMAEADEKIMAAHHEAFKKLAE